MSTSIGARSRRLAVALGAALIAGSFAIPAAAAVPQGIGPSAAQLAKIVPVSGAKACVARHDGVAYRTLQAAVDAADPGETVTVQGTCAGFTYVGKDLTIQGVQTATSGKPTLTGQRAIPILAVGGVILKPGARPAGVGYGFGSRLTVRGLRIANGAVAEQGVITLMEGAALTLTNTTVARNRGGDTGAIYGVQDNLVVLRGSTEVRNNRNFDDDAGAIELDDDGLVVMRGNASVHHNRSREDEGGAFNLECGASLHMYDDSAIFNNRSGDNDDAGAVDVDWDNCEQAEVILNDRASIHTNFSLSDGGAISACGGDITLNDDARIYGNSAVDGGGLELDCGSTLTLNDRSRITGNVAVEDGGAVDADGDGGITLNDSARISGNRALSGDGGAVILQSSSVITLNDSTRISLNRAESDGGAVYSSDSSQIVLAGSARIAGNRTDLGRGGGIFLTAVSALAIGGTSQVSGNRAPEGAGIWVGANATLDYDDTGLVTGNTASIAGGGVWAACGATIIDQNVGTNNTLNTPDDFFQEFC